MSAVHQGGRQLAAMLLVAGMGFGLSAESVPGVTDPSDTTDAQRTDAILRYIIATNPDAPIDRMRAYAAALHATSQTFEIDHCLALAQAQVESTFMPNMIGRAGEVGLYQILPTTGSIFGYRPEELRDPLLNTEVALDYLRDIRLRKPALRDALAEYNGGPRNRSPYYALTVLETYTRVLRHRDLDCAPDRHPAVVTRSPASPTGPVKRAGYKTSL